MIFEDNFQKGSLSDLGYFYFSVGSGANWTIDTANGEIHNGFSRGQSVNTVLHKSFDPIILDEIGDELVLSWTYRNGQTGDFGGVMRIELCELFEPVSQDQNGGKDPGQGAYAFGLQQNHGQEIAHVRYNDGWSAENLKNSVPAPLNVYGGELIEYSLRIVRTTPYGINIYTSVNGEKEVNNFKGGIQHFTFNAVRILAPWSGSGDRDYSRIGFVSLKSDPQRERH